MQKLHPPKEEVARRGKALYEAQVRSQVEPEFIGKVVAIDINSGEFAIGENSLNAADILLERLPEAQIWFVRVGHRAVHRIGYAGPMESS
ncbi:MAG: hypothetical protein B0A82_14520 [Alkalinema sp. CACIAM 70d]|nr:MAG: hypothetical protein B0A82_14520 [Alkalinema sp. CACIAM 70d]